MLNCDASQVLMADALYDPLPDSDQQALDAHLAQCADCRELFDEITGSKSALQMAGIDNASLDDIPERAEMDGLWDKLEVELDRIDAQRYREMKKRSWMAPAGMGLALAASVALFFSVLQVGPTTAPAEAPVQQVAQGPSNQAVNEALLRYVARAEAMLMTVANAESDNASMVPVTNSYARDMATEAGLLNASIGDNVSNGQARLLRDLEFLLLQIANLDEGNLEDGVSLLQQYIEDNSVLFRIRLLEARHQSNVL